jgi:pseudo-response regulator 7
MVSDQGGARFRGSCSPQDNSSDAVKTNSTCKMESNSDTAPVKQGSNGSSNNIDMGSSTKNTITKPSVDREKVVSPSAVKSNQHTSAFHPVQHQTSSEKVVGNDKADEETANAVKLGNSREAQQGSVQHHHQVHYYLQVMAQQQPSIGHGSNARCGSSNVSDVPIECHAANYSVNRSISGSHNESNVQIGTSSTPNIARPNMESGTIIKNGAEDGNGSGNGPSGSGNDICQNQLSQREAAVNKFRQKRKERNFEKKVTYIVSKAGSSKISTHNFICVVLIF